MILRNKPEYSDKFGKRGELEATQPRERRLVAVSEIKICPECGDEFKPGDADDGLCPWDDSVLESEDE